MRAVFIRHGQSTANTGAPSDDIALIALTETGHGQARQLADRWTETPDLIVTSPFLRTQQTAQPTRARFPETPVEVWPNYGDTICNSNSPLTPAAPPLAPARSG